MYIFFLLILFFCNNDIVIQNYRNTLKGKEHKNYIEIIDINIRKTNLISLLIYLHY